jgi:hypothetical protein
LSNDIIAQDTVVNSSDKRVTSTHIAGSNKRAIDVSLAGGSSAAGGQNGPAEVIKTTLTTTPANLTALTTLDSYNTINIKNEGNVSMEINFVDTWTLGDGWTILAGGGLSIDIIDNVTVYARTLSGTAIIKILVIGNT